MNDITSVLKLDKLVFDKISFDRQGFKSKNQIKFRIETRFAQNAKNDVYRITLILKGDKTDEYSFEISLTGFFTFEGNSDLDEATKNELITKNTIAILMPYMRSQVSLLTAQPEMDCVVLPAFNINKIVNEQTVPNE